MPYALHAKTYLYQEIFVTILEVFACFRFYCWFTSHIMNILVLAYNTYAPYNIKNTKLYAFLICLYLLISP